MPLHGITGHEIWNTRETPALILRAAAEPEEEGIVLPPPARGTRIRIVDIEPERPEMSDEDRSAAAAEFGAVGGGSAYKGSAKGAHPMMHRTETIDYGIVLEGEIMLILEESETLVKRGDVIVQVGTNHAWANRSANICRIAFILIDGQYDDGVG